MFGMWWPTAVGHGDRAAAGHGETGDVVTGTSVSGARPCDVC